MKRSFRMGLALIAVLMLVLCASGVGLADAGGFGGDTDWGDSGWDSGSDWGSSDWGSSDWDSGSSASDWATGFGTGAILGSSSDYSSSSSEDDGGSMLLGLVVIAIIVIVIIRMKKKNANSGAQVYQASQEDAGIPLENLKQKDPDFNEQAFLEQIGNMYMQMQNAWQSKEWEPMRAFMTDSLYNQMARQLEELKAQGLTNHVERIAVLDSFIKRYAVEGDNDVLTVRLSTRICDYYTNDMTGQVVRGSQTKELFMTYDWRMTRQKDQKTQQEAAMSDVSCPNCGAPLSIKQTGKCPYCDTVVTISAHDWVLSSIKGISQRSN